MNLKHCILTGCCFLYAVNLKAQEKATSQYHEPYRPQIHFSPKEKWMNDPNGMVYYKGTYHLFFQYYPKDIVWGPMHWGHATSTDLIHWKQLPIALYPDSLGFIFSGSAVIDEHNTTGFGKNGKVPMVAIFTHHDPVGERAGKSNFQNESLAYSLDEGNTWTKYAGNPVLKNPGIRDFRDPKVMWYAPENKWVMTLATKDRVTFFSSPNLKDWHKESEFGAVIGQHGAAIGAHGGVWECPDLFTLNLDGKTYWVLIVNLNPGGPNGGSATQYFVGQFDGNKFVPLDEKTRWMDYGPDEYAGITWNNTGSRKLFLGWMSNWQYAGQVPTVNWRNAMTLPRELVLKSINNEMLVASAPVKELKNIELSAVHIPIPDGKQAVMYDQLPGQFVLKFNAATVADYSVILSNNDGEQLTIGFDKANNRYFLDRSKSGKIDFNPEFGKVSYAPRISTEKTTNLKLVADGSSVELFADDGLSVMTGIFFPTQSFNHLKIKGDIDELTLSPLKSIW